jgi:hypothetical protein
MMTIVMMMMGRTRSRKRLRRRRRIDLMAVKTGYHFPFTPSSSSSP